MATPSEKMPNPATSFRRIDVHHHLYPSAYVAETLSRIMAIGPGFPESLFAGWTAERTLAEMDENGVDAAILSIATPGVWFGDQSEGRRLARICNDFGAGLIERYPGRFGMFGVIPMADVDGSLKEIEYCLDELGLDGIGILSSYGQRWPGDETFAPVFEELNRRKTIVLVHPTAPREFMSLVPDVPPAIAEFPFDTTRAILSLVFSGRTSQNSDIRFIFTHGGGTIPFLADRVASLARRPTAKELAARIPMGVEHELRKFYYDVVSIAGNPHGMRTLLSFANPENLLFGTDAPYLSPKLTADGLGRIGLPPTTLEAIARGNALRLFPRLGGPADR